MFTKHILILTAILMTSLCAASAGYAQVDTGRNVLGTQAEYKIPYRSDEYLEPSYKNFEFILWRYGGYDIEDENHILRFIALNDCKLFKRYMNYDLEWTRIKNRYKDFLAKNYSMFPGRIRVRVPIGLKRFDEKASTFTLSDDTQFNAIRILPVKRFEDTVKADCVIRQSYLENYKQHMLNDVAVSLKYPLTLKEIPVPTNEAKKYIEYVQRHNSYNQKVKGRVAYTFYDIEIFDYIRRTQSGGHLLYGEVVNVEVFADEEGTFALYSFDPKEGLESATERKSLISSRGANNDVENEK
jgi:hypothetical protein